MSTAARRAARMNLPAERRLEISRMGGIARAASAGPDKLREIGAKGNRVYMHATTPERRREIARLGAHATNLKRWGFRA